MLEERLNYLSILSRESNITQSLLYDEVIKEYAAKKFKTKTLLSCIRQFIIENIIYFFVDFFVCDIYQLFKICNFLILNEYSLSCVILFYFS